MNSVFVSVFSKLWEIMDIVSHHQTVVFIISHVGSCSLLILLQSVLLFISLEYGVQFIRPTAL